MMTTNRVGGLMLVGILAVATACGSDEDSLEQLLEEQSGEDVDVELGDDGISIESDDGSLTIDEDGNFVVTDDEGQVITGDVDVDGDSVVVQSEDGEVTFESDGDSGSFEITGEDGDVSITGSEEFPEDWPAVVPEPTGLDIVGSSTFVDAQTEGYTVVGTTATSPEDFLASYGPMLEAAGFVQVTFFESEGSVSAFYEGSGWVITVAGVSGDASGDGQNNVTVSVNAADG